MSTKASRNTHQILSETPNKAWPANVGILPDMRARPITRTEDIEGMFEFCYLQPVPMALFMAEMRLMEKAGYYHTGSVMPSLQACPSCHKVGRAMIEYVKNHRNGKPDLKGSRSFIVCPSCFNVEEEFTRDCQSEKKGSDQAP